MDIYDLHRRESTPRVQKLPDFIGHDGCYWETCTDIQEMRDWLQAIHQGPNNDLLLSSSKIEMLLKNNHQTVAWLADLYQRRIFSEEQFITRWQFHLTSIAPSQRKAKTQPRFPTTLPNRLEAAMWTILHAFCAGSLAVSVESVGIVWSEASRQKHSQVAVNRLSQELKLMDGHRKLVMYNVMRGNLIADIRGVDRLFENYLETSSQLTLEEEEYTQTVLGCALLLLSVTPRIQAVTDVIDVRFTPLPGVDISATTLSPHTRNPSLNFLLFGGKGEVSHPPVSVPLHSSISELLLVWSYYSAMELDCTNRHLFKTRTTRSSHSWSTMSSRTLQHLSKLGLDVDSERKNHACRDMTLGIFSELTHGNPLLVHGLCRAYHSSIQQVDATYHKLRDLCHMHHSVDKYLDLLNLKSKDDPASDPNPALLLQDIPCNSEAVQKMARTYTMQLMSPYEDINATEVVPNNQSLHDDAAQNKKRKRRQLEQRQKIANTSRPVKVRSCGQFEQRAESRDKRAGRIHNKYI